MANVPSNLTMHRAAHTVWDRQDHEHARARTMGMAGVLLMAAGAVLVGQAYKAQISALRYLPPMPKRAKKFDEINQAAEGSFPASDPPAWTPAVGKPGTAEFQR